ncbi:LemA family protein [[Mycoplasma] testudinis]|uniref:LemA family protein n=1 Tax=[Mycoplasma] testudinis TaxID=33924 RepID=UPI000489CB45|nr:LemA family protein [[Mycoplasma] testudinis]
MLVNTRVASDPQGFNPNVDNTVRPVVATFRQKIGWFLLIIVTLSILYWVSIKWANWFKKQQMEINEMASNIDVNLTKRRELLLKLLEQTKGYLHHEKETFTLVAKYRGNNASKDEVNKLDGNMSKMFSDINIAFEQYPQLKGNETVRELMGTTQYLETEIAAARRLYNSEATSFNAEIFQFPKMMKAAAMRLQTFPLYGASAQQKTDVDMSSLSAI